MGFFDKIKKVFDKGGVDVDVDAPHTFRWSDGQLPLAVQVSNGSDEERVVTQLEVRLHEDVRMTDRDEDESPSDQARDVRRAERSGLTFTHAEPLTLSPGSTVTVELSMPLSLQGAVDAVGGSDEAPGWLSAASSAVNAFKEATREEEWYRLKVTPTVEGFSAVDVASIRIRNLRFGEREIGGVIWTHRFG